MSHALIALILIHVDAHDGQWVSLNWLAGRTLTPMHKIKPICDQLVAQGQLQHALVGDIDSYGIHVTQPEAQP